MNTTLRRLLAAFAVLSLGFAGAACSEEEGEDAEVTESLTETNTEVVEEDVTETETVSETELDTETEVVEEETELTETNTETETVTEDAADE